MANLVSPGVQVTVTDLPNLTSAGQGTVPLIFIATAANKISSDGTSIAPGTQTSGVLYLASSQRDLLQQFGLPTFEMLDGSVIQASEVSEYGLHAAWSYLGLANSAYVCRADIDLAQLKYTSTMPSSPPTNGTYWFNLTATAFGIFRANGNPVNGLSWDIVTPTLYNSLTQTNNGSPDYAPLNSIGSNGDIAVVTATTSNSVYEKISGTWYLVGSTSWEAQKGASVALGTVVNPTFNIGDQMIIDGNVGNPFVVSHTDLANTIIDINTWATSYNPNISASNNGNHLQLSDTTGAGITIAGAAGVNAGLNINASITQYYGHLIMAPHTQVPQGVQTGNIWIKTTNPNFGANYIVEIYSVTTGQFGTVYAPLYLTDSAADTAYGAAKVIGDLYVQYNSTGTTKDPIATHVIKRWDGTNWDVLTYTASLLAPTNPAAAGALWISDESFIVDIMVNNGNQWMGYKNYYPATDASGVQITSAQPTTQANGNPLVDNDLWLNSDDLVNYPALYRYSATSQTWTRIDNTDHTTPFGIVFEDARPNADGTLNGATDAASMLASNFVDPNTPNPETFPPQILLFNTLYSNYNVKKWNPTEYQGQGPYTVGAFSNNATWAATNPGRWTTASGNKVDGSPYMGRFAQHQMVVNAFNALISSNDQIRSDFTFFNIITTPGYPEVIETMVELNVDRNETAFIIADTPMHLAASSNAIQNWATNTADVPVTDEFGRTNLYTYSAEYYPHGLGTNIDGESVVIPSSTIALRTYGYSDSVSYVWVSPAGTQRGVVQNATSVGYVDDSGTFQPVVLNQGQRDTLYTNDINPIAFLPNRGLIVYGDKTLDPNDDLETRVNVARLVCFLRYQLRQLGQPFLFQLNNDSTRSAAESVFQRFLGDLLSAGAITDFAVVCDTSNNTPTTIALNQLWIDVAIVPAFSIDFIYIPIVLESTLNG